MKSRFTIIILFFIVTFSFGQDIKIISSTSSSIVIEYKATITDSSSVLIDNQLYKRFSILNGFTDPALVAGNPETPIREVCVGVPSEYGNTIQILETDSYSIDGRLTPVPEYQRDEFGFSADYKIKNEYTNPSSFEIIGFGEFGIVRNLQVQNIIMHPIQFDPVSQKITIHKKILFRINYGRTGNNYSEISEEYLSDVVLNFSVAKNWGIVTMRDELRKINSSSALSNGTWFKFPVTEEGIYKIDRSKLSSYGIDAATVDPRTIKIYNNGGYILPEGVNDEAADDLIENAVLIFGEEDGKFDEGDYILFYGRGTNFWEYDNSAKQAVRRKHWYSKANYYFITSGGANGKRMVQKNSLNELTYFEQNSTHSYHSFEEDKINKDGSGKIYVGDEFSASSTSKTYVTSLPHLIPGEVNYQFSFVNYSSEYHQLKIDESGTTLLNKSIDGSNGYYSTGKLYNLSAEYNGVFTENRSMLRIEYIPGPGDFGYLDYFEIVYPMAMMASDDILYVYSLDTTSVIQYTFSNFGNSDILVFDVTNFSEVNRINPLMLSGGQFKFQSARTKGSLSKYFGICSNKILTPPAGSQISNSDIHGNTSGSEYVIIANKNFSEETETLADYRNSESLNKFSTKVFYIDEIYNEFSGGIIDPTAIRNFLKYAYNNWQIKPFYVLLFGDGSYDVLDTEAKGNNFIPTFQTEESFNYVFSYPYDDYYARIIGTDKKVDLALSRLNVNSQEEAEIYIDKIKFYENESGRGLWRNLITLVADDGLTTKGDDGNQHTKQVEDLANNYVPKYFDKNRIYLSMYPTVLTTLGRRKPGVNEAIVNAVNAGTLLLNYTGHGNEKVWAHEEALDCSVNLNQFKNDKLFFLTAATCEFGKYDNPGLASGAEKMLLLEGGGMIGGIAASRAVEGTSNSELNNLFYQKLFDGKDANDLPHTIGMALFNTKQKYSGINDEKFHLFGEPVLRLSQPELTASIDSLNGRNLNSEVQLKALGEVIIKGSVLKSDGSADNSYDGEALISVFDSENSVYLSDIDFSVTVQGGLIFRGRASITGGEFEASFIVPKDISYENKNGKLSAYILNDESDGFGFTNKIVIGGFDTTKVNDNKGPEIEIFYDEPDIESSYLVNPDFKLFVKIEDETGLNTTGSGIGHKLEGILNGDEENPIDFTDYFIGDLNAGGKSGMIEYEFIDLEPGDYSIRINAWDVFNNGGTAENNFCVVSSTGLTIRDVYNYPNPFSDFTVFTFQHNLTSAIDVKIKIYTVAGRLIKEIEQQNVSDKFVKIFWDGRDADGSAIANGTYLYKIQINSDDGQTNQGVLGKLCIIR
ncbi:MAG: type IX secretion system sortase PorU [bacterium]